MHSRRAMICEESLMYKGVVSGLIMWSRNAVMHSVGPLQPLTMGLIPWGVLCSFLKKYMRCVLDD